jgi:hypothetical protein
METGKSCLSALSSGLKHFEDVGVRISHLYSIFLPILEHSDYEIFFISHAMRLEEVTSANLIGGLPIESVYMNTCTAIVC